MKDKPPLRVGSCRASAQSACEVAKRLIAGVPGLTLRRCCSCATSRKARRALPRAGTYSRAVATGALANSCDIVVECLPPVLFRDVAISAIDKSRSSCRSVAQLLENGDLIERARHKGARILVPTGALIGLDAARRRRRNRIHSVKMVTRKPPAGLRGRALSAQTRNFSGWP